jgi:hypothetical protein
VVKIPDRFKTIRFSKLCETASIFDLTILKKYSVTLPGDAKKILLTGRLGYKKNPSFCTDSKMYI